MLNIKHLIMIKMNDITPSWLLLLLWCGRLAVLSKEELSRNCKSFKIMQTKNLIIHCEVEVLPQFENMMHTCEAGMVQIGFSKQARKKSLSKGQIIQKPVKTFRSTSSKVK